MKINKEMLLTNLSASSDCICAMGPIDSTLYPANVTAYGESSYHPFHKWHAAYIPVHKDRFGYKCLTELMDVTQGLLDIFRDPATMFSFCSARAVLNQENAYDLYYKGEEADYWIRAISKTGAHTIKVHSIYKKGGS